MRTMKITQHLSVAELEQRYRQAHDPVERSHWHIIWLHAQGYPVRTIMAVTSYSQNWVYTILHRYDTLGPDGVGDGRHNNPGHTPLVPPEVREKLRQMLDGPAPDGGIWTSKKVAAWLEQELGVEHIHIPRAWELLRSLGYRSSAPRPRHAKADPAVQAEWKKKLPEQIKTIQDAHPTVEHWELWTMDEHRIGLKPIIRRIWTRKGERPIVTVNHRYQWCYLFGFVCPQTGETFWLLIPRVSVEAFSLALAELARGLGVGPTKHLILILDQAGWHTSDRVEVPDGIHLLFQPSYSPEVQPAERLWELTDEALANCCFTTIEELVDAQVVRCNHLREQEQETIRSRTCYHWWPLLSKTKQTHIPSN